MTKREEAIRVFKGVIGSREPKHKYLSGQLGDAAGTVEVPDRPNYVYVRLSGAPTRTVRAYNMAVMPEADRYVQVKVSRSEGGITDYQIVAYSAYESAPGSATPPVYPGGQSAAEKVVTWAASDFFTNEKVHNALTGVDLHKNIASNIEMLKIGTATYDDVQDWLNTTQSSGHLTGGALSDGMSGTLDVAAGTGFIKTVDSDVGLTKFFDWEADSGIALTDGRTNYIYVNYNTGTQAITIEVTLDRTNIPLTTAFDLGRVFRDGNDLHLLVSDVHLHNLARNDYERALATRGFEHASGGEIAETGQRYLTSTEGVFYLGQNHVHTDAEDTSGTDRFVAWYLLNGTWTDITGQQQIDNLQYNDVSVGGAEVLANLTANRYGVFWIYVHMDGDIQVVYGQGNYKLTGAENAVVPSSLPELVGDFGILAAKIIVQQNQNNLLSAVSAYLTLFPISAPSAHNDLGGLQGGTTDEYYHLTATEHGYVSGVNAQSVLTTAEPAFKTITLSHTIGPIVTAQFLSAAVDTVAPNLELWHLTSGDMADGFGVGFRFVIGDAGTPWEEIALIVARRDGADNEGALEFYCGTGGGELFLKINASGNIGMGVTDPDTLLELYRIGTQLKLSGGADDFVTFAVAADGQLTITTVDDDAEEGHIVLAPDGNVQIPVGNLVPAAGLGTIGLAGDRWGIGYFTNLYATTAIVVDDAGYIGIGGAVERIVFDAAGVIKVLGAKFEVNSGIVDIVANFESSDSIAEILLTDNAGFVRLRNTGGVLSFWTTAQALTVLANGRVGIGIAVPTVALHVYEATGAVSVKIETGDDSAVGFTLKSTLANEWNFSTVLTSGNFRIRDVTGGANPFLIEAGANANALYIHTSGRVGINTAVPLAKLHIDQSNAGGALPVLLLDQADESEGTINFIAVDRGVIDEGVSSVESVRVELGGVVRRLALYADA